ncbi:MAG: glucose PTS transporter subunit IIA [Succinivibrionaceae bacterium]
MGLGLLGRLKNLLGHHGLDRKGFPIYAPISGEVIPLDDVPDVIFSERIVGDGIAIKPTSDRVVAPVNGCVVQIFETNHCIIIRAPNNAEIMIHLGIDTEDLAGMGFKRLISVNQNVSVGDPLLELDLPYLETNAKSTITPVVISNVSEVHLSHLDHYEGKVSAGSSIVMNAFFDEVRKQ